MIFTSAEFVAFFLVFFPVFLSLRGTPRKLFLLVASCFFYGCYSIKFLVLILVSTLVDFVVAHAIRRATLPRRRKAWLGVSLAWNFGALAWFKYAAFFSSAATDGLGLLGASVSLPFRDVALPVGISFYTFQSVGYAIDVYRERLAPTRSLLDYALFVTFFPQLVSGPIERGGHLLPQIAQLGRKNLQIDWSGWGMIALGAFKKVCLADRFAEIVKVTYEAPADTVPVAMWIGTYAFAVQIYCDFSGYSDIAVGCARLMGIEIVQNFESPYAADGPREFWRRWHISLSTWLRDYLFISLGGSRGGKWRTARNLLVTMLLGGLWHGAAWNFVLWGAFHGTLLVIAHFWNDATEKIDWRFVPAALRSLVGFVQRIAFFHVTCLGWALFRAQSVHDCKVVFTKLLDVGALDFSDWLKRVERSGEQRYFVFLGAILVLLLLIQSFRKGSSKTFVAALWRLPAPVKFGFVVVCIYAAAVLAPAQPPPFIYFQF